MDTISHYNNRKGDKQTVSMDIVCVGMSFNNAVRTWELHKCVVIFYENT